MRKQPILLVIAGTFLVGAGLIGWNLLAHSPSEQVEEISPDTVSLGVSGELLDVSDLPLSVALQQGVQKKIAFEFSTEVKPEENHLSQADAYAEIYPGYQLDDVAMVIGFVKEINRKDRLVRLQTDDGEGWVKISNLWHGNSQRKDAAGIYQQEKIFNVPRGMWIEMAAVLEVSTRVMFLCADSSCQEIIGGHIYLD